VPRCYRKHDSLTEAGSRISNIEMQDCAERVRRCTERKSILAHESEYCSRRGSIRVGQSTCLSIAKTMIGLDRAELMRTDTKRAILRNNEKRGYKCVWNSSFDCKIHQRRTASFKRDRYIDIIYKSIHLLLWYNDIRLIMLCN